MVDTCVLTGEDLAVEDVWRVAVERVPIELGDVARTKIRAARELVERAAYGLEEHTYGVNTGFGRFHTVSIPAAHTEELQVRLLRSHACGVGDPYPDEIVRAAMLLRANALAEGHSGAREETVELLVECLNRGVVPRVPSRGSVGASGDLAPAGAPGAAVDRRGRGVGRRRVAAAATPLWRGSGSSPSDCRQRRGSR